MATMPEISRFHGIIVRMFQDDHGTPHFHARYAEYTVRVDIPSGVVEGRFPPRALRHLFAWYHRRKPELLENWRRVSDPAPTNPNVQVIDARYLGGYRVWLRFDDGLEGEIDLENALWGEVFRPLKDPAYFAQFTVDWTLTWPNGADLAPESLYQRVLGARRSA